MIRRRAIAGGACGLGAIVWLAIGACSTDYGAQGDPANEGGSTIESGATDTSTNDANDADRAADTGLPVECKPALPPNDATKSAEIHFDGISTAGMPPTGWKAIGSDRDGRCTTVSSTDVCKRPTNGSTEQQLDGDDGRDNAWGHSIQPLLGGFGNNVEGWLKTDATGTGTMILMTSLATLEVPVVSALVKVTGSTATFTALVPVEPFIVSFQATAGRADPSLCSGSTIEDLKTQVRQAADIPLDGIHNAAVICDAISIGAVFTGVSSTTAPVYDGGSPCP